LNFKENQVKSSGFNRKEYKDYIRGKLINFVKQNASCRIKPNQEKEYYVKESKKVLFRHYFLKLISGELSIGLSTSNEEFKSRYRTFGLFFLPDKKKYIKSPEIQWLIDYFANNTNSSEKNDATCYFLLQFCYQRLDPLNEENNTFGEFDNLNELIEWLKQQKKNTEMIPPKFYDSLIYLAKEYDKYSKETLVIKQVHLQSILFYLPLMTSAYCLSIFSMELTAVYGLCFLSFNAGRYLEHLDSNHLKLFGKALKSIGEDIPSNMTLLVLKLFQMNCYLINGSVTKAVTYANSIYSSLTSFTDNRIIVKSITADCFHTPSLRQVAEHLISYLDINRKQWGKKIRTGGRKRRKFKSTLSLLLELDQIETSSTHKAILAKSIINDLKKDEKIYKNGKNARLVIDKAILTLENCIKKADEKEERQVAICI